MYVKTLVKLADLLSVEMYQNNHCGLIIRVNLSMRSNAISAIVKTKHIFVPISCSLKRWGEFSLCDTVFIMSINIARTRKKGYTFFLPVTPHPPSPGMTQCEGHCTVE